MQRGQLSKLNTPNTMNKLPERIHVIGICGVAMSAIAIAFHKRGVIVTGSDKGFFPPVSTELERQGISFYAGWHPEKMIDSGVPDLIIVGTASGTQNPETIYANQNNIPTYSYPEIIGKYFTREKSIACCGTWGKTSSTALLSFILDYAGLEPSYMIGGISLSHEASAKLTDGKYNVLEGDEYKSSPTDTRAKFIHYKPNHLLLSAVSWDHADLYPTEDSYFNAFRNLLKMIPDNGLIVLNSENTGIKKLNAEKLCKARIVSYGENTGDYRFNDLKQDKNGLEFEIIHDNKKFLIHSPMIGAFQAENITGCFAMAYELKINPQTIIEAISKFKGLKRRLEKRLEKNNITVFDDIAHSPEKASYVLETLRQIYKGKIVVIFEPNSGGRSRESIKKYDDAFRKADMVIIPRLTKLKISNNADEQPIEGEELAQIISKTHKNCTYVGDDDALVTLLEKLSHEVDVIAFLGSHGFRGMIENTIEGL